MFSYNFEVLYLLLLNPPPRNKAPCVFQLLAFVLTPLSQYVFVPLPLAAPGLIGLRVDGPRGALVEVNSETDFVARNAKFQEFVEKVLEVALEKDRTGAEAAGASARELNVNELLQAEHPGWQMTPPLFAVVVVIVGGGVPLLLFV